MQKRSRWEPLSAFQNPKPMHLVTTEHRISIQFLTRYVLCLEHSDQCCFCPVSSCRQWNQIKPNHIHENMSAQVCTKGNVSAAQLTQETQNSEVWIFIIITVLTLSWKYPEHSEGKEGKFSSIFSPNNLPYSQDYFKNMDWSNYSAFVSVTYTGHY